MQIMNAAPTLDLDHLIQHLSEQISQGEREDKRVQGARIRSHHEKICDKRQERLDNLKEQMRSASKGGCISLLRNIAKVFDILLKPLSAITAGQLKLELGKALESLQKAKDQKQLMGLKIAGKEMGFALDQLKKFLQEDLDSSQQREKIQQNQEEQIFKIVEELHQGFLSTQQIS